MMNIKKELFVGALSILLIIFLSGGAVLYYQSENKQSSLKQNPDISNNQQTAISKEEVAKHATESDCWIIISGKVYDVTGYLSQHPGGAFRIIPFCGKDATQAFMTKGGEGQHSSEATAELQNLYKGDLYVNVMPSEQGTPVPTMPVGNSTDSQGASLTMTEIAKHATSSDCWLVIENKVYDATSYISKHPGGAQRIINFCGQDATQAFATKGGNGSHSSAATQDLSTLYIGDLNQTQVKQVDTNAVQSLPVRGEREDDDND